MAASWTLPQLVLATATVALILAPATTGLPYLQFGVDAARTGVTGDEGPEHFDLAFEVALPGAPAFLSTPVVVGDSAFVAVDAPREHGVYHVDLASAKSQRLIPFDAAPTSLASDGTRLFIATPTAIAAYGLDGEGPLWAWPFPPVPVPGMATACAPLALDGADLVAACTQGTGAVQLPPPLAAPRLASQAPEAFVVSLATADGNQRWTWSWGSENNCATGACTPDPANAAILTSLAVAPDRVVVAGVSEASWPPEESPGPLFEYSERVRVVALDRETGARVWGREPGSAWSNAATDEAAVPNNVPAPALALSGHTAYVLTWDLEAVFLEDGSSAWSEPVTPLELDRGRLPSAGWYGSGLAVDGPTIYASGVREVVAFDVSAGQPEPRWRRPINGDLDQLHGLSVVGGHVLGSTYDGRLFALDKDAGDLRYIADHAGEDGGVRLAIGDGVVVVAAPAGRLSFIGRTPAALAVAWSVGSLHPLPGEPVTVSVSASPGAFGAATGFQVDWGDGSVDTWRDASTFEHVYERPGDVAVRAFARNDAGQVASEAFTLHVGGSQPNVIETAFARDNQDLTFGLLGVALALGGGLFAVTRTRTRRRRVQRELDAIEQAFAVTRDRPRDAEAALAERRAHVRGLGLDGKLDQAEVLLLERRIDELARELRLGTLEHKFHFLPYGFVMSLREMLEDGSISVWERDHLQRAIHADRAMTDEQKGLVRALVDEWAERDDGGSG